MQPDPCVAQFNTISKLRSSHRERKVRAFHMGDNDIRYRYALKCSLYAHISKWIYPNVVWPEFMNHCTFLQHLLCLMPGQTTQITCKAVKFDSESNQINSSYLHIVGCRMVSRQLETGSRALTGCFRTAARSLSPQSTFKHRRLLLL